MSTGIFHIDQNGNLSEMSQQEYSSEDLLQKLLEDYPSLIPGNQVDELNPRKWIFISREFSVPDSESSSGRWSLDHLFLDQDGIAMSQQQNQFFFEFHENANQDF